MGGIGSGGHNRKDTPLRVLEGNRGKSKIPAQKPSSGPVTGPPGHLQPVVAQIWVELKAQAEVPKEAAAGFELLCHMMAEFRAGHMTATRLMVLRGLLNDFGMTTASRERLGSKAPAETDELERILRG